MSNSTTSADTSIPPPASTSTTPIDTSSTVAPVSTSVDTTSTTAAAPTSSDSTAAATTSTAPTTADSSTSTTAPVIVTHTSATVFSSSDGHPASTVFITETSTATAPSSKGSSSSISTTSAGLAGASDASKSSSSGGLSTGGKTAIAVVIPIVAVAALIAAGIWWWRRRRANRDAEDLRRKEVEEYGYNPNNDPTLPPVGDGPYEMVQDGSTGYRGWGTTAAGSSNRKGSTTVASGGAGQGVGSHAYSESTSPTLNNGGIADNRSGEPLMGGHSPTYHPIDDGGEEMLGAMGPSTSNNNRGEVQRGPSNASSSYSAANRSDGSGEVGAPGGAIGQANYYNEYTGVNSGGPYNDGGGYGGGNVASGAGPAAQGQPIIRDVQAKRNTRIEHPSHFPQQGGISQNF